MNSEEKKSKVQQAKGKILEEGGKAAVTETRRFKGRMDKAENKARAVAGKARGKNQGHEAVSDQKSHDYH